MKKSCLTLALLLLLPLASRSVRAQAVATASGPGSYVTVGGGASAFQQDYGRRVIGGGFLYADVHPTWRYGFEGQVRYLRLRTSQQVNETTYLAGGHMALRNSRLQPYVKLLAGAGHINLPYGYAQGTFLTVAAGGGFDYRLNERVAVRVVDFEYQKWRNFPFGELRPYGVSAGLSFRVNGFSRYPKGMRYRH